MSAKSFISPSSSIISSPDLEELTKLQNAFKNKSFYLNNRFNWEIKVDDFGKNCLIPTKK